AAAVLIADQIRQWHGLAELLAAARQRHRHVDRLPAADAAHRGALRPLRWASRAPVRGRSAADRAALLHQRHPARVPARSAEIDLTAATASDPAGLPPRAAFNNRSASSSRGLTIC